MFLGRKRDGTVPRTRPINHADMLMCVRDPMNVQKPGGNQGPGARFGGGGPVADQLDLQTALLARFAQGRPFGIFIQFNVTSQWQPLV